MGQSDSIEWTIILIIYISDCHWYFKKKLNYCFEKPNT